MNSESTGTLVLSLDFELMWGVQDHTTIGEYRERLLRTREVIPSLLALFRKYDVAATWATVGFLFADGRGEVEEYMPNRTPDYEQANYSTYRHLRATGNSESDDPLHYAPSLVARIRDADRQEVGTHSFSHYFCLEKGQELEAWRADLKAAHQIARSRGVELDSLVFPRNQFNRRYLTAVRESGIEAYRGNPGPWIYESRRRDERTIWMRGLRLLDAHLPIFGPLTHEIHYYGEDEPVDVAASRFLRPWTPKSSLFERWRRQRILGELESAAKEGHCYHLWWHPHNFGAVPEENIRFLESVLEEFDELRSEYSMQSRTMRQVARDRNAN